MTRECIAQGRMIEK